MIHSIPEMIHEKESRIAGLDRSGNSSDQYVMMPDIFRGIVAVEFAEALSEMGWGIESYRIEYTGYIFLSLQEHPGCSC